MRTDGSGIQQNNNIMKMKKTLLMLSIMFFTFCQDSNKAISRKVIDDFIKNHQSESFLEFKNKVIFIRQETLLSTIYILHKYEGNKPVYFVTYSKLKNEVTEIDNSMLKKEKVPDYFTVREITSLVKRFRAYKFCMVGVDLQENVFINPFYPNNPAVFLRKSNHSQLNISKMQGNYVHYNAYWYIDQSQLVGVKL